MRPRVLVIYTGGTFGMDARLGIPRLSAAKLRGRVVASVPELASIARCDIDVLLNRDSGHMGPNEWVLIARRVRERWTDYDGVVVLHGTDTLAYTASALSFLLRPCLKPVILTGAQRPLSALRSDARRNLVSAVEIAARGPRPFVNRVMVCFDDRLLQGNRVRKRSASEFDAFESPQAPALAIVGTAIRYREEKTRKPRRLKTAVAAAFSRKVAMLHVTPGFPSREVTENLLPHLDGLVLVIYPSGTAPTNEPEFLRMLRAARKRKLPVVIVTEGATRAPGAGAHPDDYVAGRKLLAEGCLWAGEMTPECAYVKASLLLAQPAGRKYFARDWRIELAGEGSA